VGYNDIRDAQDQKPNKPGGNSRRVCLAVAAGLSPKVNIREENDLQAVPCIKFNQTALQLAASPHYHIFMRSFSLSASPSLKKSKGITPQMVSCTMQFRVCR
jgi:hypothetical protein